jgi:hypothetical protein
LSVNEVEEAGALQFRDCSHKKACAAVNALTAAQALIPKNRQSDLGGLLGDNACTRELSPIYIPKLGWRSA